MTEPSRISTIDQALFGYADGHRQLAASTEFTSADAYELATRSDLVPGAHLRPAESYVSGFILKDSGAFAFLKTWLAPEMTRPGCVWSHVLILPRTFLVGQVDLGVLLALFRRPYRGQRLAGYDTKIEVKRLGRGSGADPDFVATIAEAYYAGSGQVACDILQGDDFERALMAVWSQQWPKLRFEFAFRTAFGPGVADGKGLVFRIIAPISSKRPTVPSSDGRAEWISAAVGDAMSPSITHLRRFLWRYGKDVGRSRRAFEPLIRLYLASRTGKGAEAIADEVLHYFPATLDAATLKKDLLGVPAGAPPLIPRLDGAGLVKLATQADALTGGLIGLAELATATAGLNQAQLKRALLAFGTPETPFGGAEEVVIRDTIAQCINPEALTDPEVPRTFVVDVLRGRPDLIEQFDVDYLTPDDALALLEVAGTRASLRRLLRRLLGSIPSPAAVDVIGRHAQDAFVEAVRLSAAESLEPGWQDALPQKARMTVPDAIQELNGRREVSHAARLVRFSTSVATTPDRFLEAARRPGPEPSADEDAALDAYLLALSLRYGPTASTSVVSDVLPRLRSRALTGGLGPTARALLDEHLPYTSESWDLNKRLLKVLRRMHRAGMDVTDILKRSEVLDQEVAYVLEEDAGGVTNLIRAFWSW